VRLLNSDTLVEKNALAAMRDRLFTRERPGLCGSLVLYMELYEKVKHIKDCIFYTDNWSSFSEVLPPERHVVRKTHTVTSERDDSNTRHHLGRFTRRTKVVSRKVAMVDMTLRLRQALTLDTWFEKYQNMALSIYRRKLSGFIMTPFKGNAGFRLKKIWKALPASIRELPFRCMCMLFLGNRRHVRPVADVPIYIVGNFQAGGGIARSAQLYAARMREKHRHCVCVDTTREMLQTVKNPLSDGSVRSLADIRDDAGSGTVIVHLNPPQFLWLLCLLRRKFFRHKHVIAYWAWELEDIPALWKFALRFVDAVEVPSTFTQAAVARNTVRRVSVRPHVVPEPSVVKQAFARGGILRCLFVFDMASLCSRKNPQGAIAAVLRAFTPKEACLTIKVSQPEASAAEWENLQALAGPHPHIRLIDGWMDDAALERLFLEHDVYLSLHRSEGYGLTLREAMLHNLYVVATGWSGNMDFMRGERVFPVAYTLVPVNGSGENFGGVRNPRWAEPDVEDAANILKHIYGALVAREDPAAVGGEGF
jgi:hypothetical protein